MINYSVYTRGNGIKPNEPHKAYAYAQVRETMDIRDLAKHISEHNCPFSKGTILGVVESLYDCMKEQLLEGKKVRLGEIGDFYVTLNSRGAGSLAEFTDDNITAVNVAFTPGSEMKNLIKEAKFNQVSKRILQRTVLQAEREGLSYVDISTSSSSPVSP